MALEAAYSVGGILDEIRKINFPPFIFPDPTKPFVYVKGFRIDVPAQTGMFNQEFVVPWDCNLIGISLTCSGYGDGDYWEVSTSEQISTVSSTPIPLKFIETCYTKELPESIQLDATFPVIPSGTTISVDFYNESGTSKIVWLNMKFLHG
jgi:hypothetical protein